MYNTYLDMYKDGYSISMYDCIQIPIAGTLGMWDRENYFIFGILCSIRTNWTLKNIQDDDNNTWVQNYGQLTERMGYRLEAWEVPSREAFMSFIKENMKNQLPVMVCAKYRGMFYHRYYMDKVGEENHMLIVESWNPEKKIFGIRDSSFISYRGVLDDKVDILFPINIKEEMLADIWEESCDSENNHFNKYLYTLHKIDDAQEVDYYDLFEELEEQSRNCNLFVEYIKTFNERRDVFSKEDEVCNKRYVGSIRGLVLSLEHWINRFHVNVPNMEKWQQKCYNYVMTRQMVFNKLYKYAARGKDLENSEIEELEKQIVNADREFITYFCENVKNHYEQINRKKRLRLDIADMFNNRATEPSAEGKYGADMSGTGIYLVLDKESIQKANQKWKYGFLTENLTQVNGRYDNISCNRQVISVEEGIYEEIQILACSEYGSYEECLELYHDEKLVDKIGFAVSDFYEVPIFNEELFCNGASYQRTDGNIRKLDFPARIFEYSILVKKEQINRIILPCRRNIHIFSITLIS